MAINRAVTGVANPDDAIQPIYSSTSGWSTTDDAVKLIPTHCPFCGMQCGIQLKVRDEKVIGFEPWEEFPFNHGMLCPKGVKRYLQGSHPDRLLTAYARDPAAPGGFPGRPLLLEGFLTDNAAGHE